MKIPRRFLPYRLLLFVFHYQSLAKNFVDTFFCNLLCVVSEHELSQTRICDPPRRLPKTRPTGQGKAAGGEGEEAQGQECKRAIGQGSRRARGQKVKAEEQKRQSTIEANADAEVP